MNVGDECAQQAVLVVDDDPFVLRALQRLLERRGFHAVGTTDPAAALELAQRTPDAFGAVLVDERMPCMTGSELLRAIAAVAPHTFRVLLTGDEPGQMDAGAAHLVLGKPMRPEVTDRLARLLAAACAVET